VRKSERAGVVANGAIQISRTNPSCDLPLGGEASLRLRGLFATLMYPRFLRLKRRDSPIDDSFPKSLSVSEGRASARPQTEKPVVGRMGRAEARPSENNEPRFSDKRKSRVLKQDVRLAIEVGCESDVSKPRIVRGPGLRFVQIAPPENETRTGAVHCFDGRTRQSRGEALKLAQAGDHPIRRFIGHD